MSLTKLEEVDKAELDSVGDGGSSGSSNCYINIQNKLV
jgi:hypothetical protein